MRKILKYTLLAALILILGYNSVYILRPSELQVLKPGPFDAKAYVDSLWKGPLQQQLEKAVDLSELQQAITANPDTAFEKYTHALAVGNYRYALIKVPAVVEAVGTDEMLLNMQVPNNPRARMATEFIYGNAFRDAIGLIELKHFPNTTQLNQVSEALNQHVREQVIPTIKKEVKKGDRITVTGAIELNKAHIHLDDLEIIPVKVEKS